MSKVQHDEVLNQWYKDLKGIFKDGCIRKKYLCGPKKKRVGEIDIMVDRCNETLIFEVKTNFLNIYPSENNDRAVGQLIKSEEYLKEKEGKNSVEKYVIVHDERNEDADDEEEMVYYLA